jgi:hypothetical protein
VAEPPAMHDGLTAARGTDYDAVATIAGRLDKIEALLTLVVQGQQVREWYTVDEFARIVGRSEFTCREYCRLGRVHAEKRLSGRGAYASWVISHAELQRYQREGLLPMPGLSTRIG